MVDPVFEELRGLFGKASDSPEVAAFLARYPGHKVEQPRDGRQYVVAKKHGFDLLFGLPDGSYSGGRTAGQRGVITLFMNSGAVPKYEPFAPLPLGLSFADGHEELTAKLGPPERTMPWGDTEHLRTARWRVDGLLLDADYTPGQPGTKVFTLMLPEAVSG